MPEELNLNKKGSSIKKMRKIAIRLYIPLAIFMFLLLILMVNGGAQLSTENLNNSPFFLLSAWFFVSLFTDNKSKLEQRAHWYKSKWGWLIVTMILTILLMLLPSLLVIILGTTLR